MTDDQHPTTDSCCGNCAHRLVNPANVNVLKCRRYPPATHLIASLDGTPRRDISYFPLVERHWLCGEYAVDRRATT